MIGKTIGTMHHIKLGAAAWGSLSGHDTRLERKAAISSCRRRWPRTRSDVRDSLTRQGRVGLNIRTSALCMTWARRKTDYLHRMEFVEGQSLDAVRNRSRSKSPRRGDRCKWPTRWMPHASDRASRYQAGQHQSQRAGQVKVLDLASQADAHSADRAASHRICNRLNRVKCSEPQLHEPEQALGQISISAPTSSAGVVLYELTTGQRPLAAPTCRDRQQSCTLSRRLSPSQLRRSADWSGSRSSVCRNCPSAATRRLGSSWSICGTWPGSSNMAQRRRIGAVQPWK